MSISGFLTLGTAIVSGAVVPPPDGSGYAPQPVSFDSFAGGVTLNGINCNFGPVTAPWGTLTSFGVVDENNIPVVPPGTLQAPFTPMVGQMITVPQGNLSIVIGSQFSVAPLVYFAPKPSAVSNSVSGVMGLAASIIVPFSSSRTWVMITNRSNGSEIQDIGSANVTVGGGDPLYPGGGFLFNGIGAAGPIYGITTASGSPFSYIEG